MVWQGMPVAHVLLRCRLEESLEELKLGAVTRARSHTADTIALSLSGNTCNPCM